MRTTAKLLFVAITAAIGFAGTTPAFADTNCTTDAKNVTYCDVQSTSVSMGSVSTSTTSVASSDVKGMTNLRFETTNGYTTTARCVSKPSFAKVPAGYKCWVANTKGYKFQNSGRSRSGARYYFEDYIGSKYSPVGTRFYYDTAHRAWRKQNCGNFVKFSGTAALPVSKVALVKTFSAVTVTVKATQTATQKTHATASCSANGTSASADAYGSGTATASASATARAVTQQQATTAASNQASSTVSNSAQAAAFAAAQVNMYSGAWVSCSSTSSPPPPSYNAPSVSAQATSCDAQGNNPGVITGTVTNPNAIDDTVTITIGGQSISGTVAASSTASFQMPNGYAPGTYTGSASLQTAGTSASFQVTVAQCQPPQQTPPTVVNMTQLNDVDAGGTSPNFCATVNIPGSDPGTLTFAATFGSFTTSTFDVAGQIQKCTTYVAPTEVPSGGRDSVTVFVRDNTTGLSAQSSESFPINTPPPPPA